MKKHELSYRGKLYLSSILIVLVVVVCITLFLTVTASRHAQESNRSALNLLTEQAMLNFEAGSVNTAQSLYSASTGTSVPKMMFEMRSIDQSTPAYLLAKRELTNVLGYTVTSSAPFDVVAVCTNTDPECIVGSRDTEAIEEAIILFSMEGIRENCHGTVKWIRLDNGSVWLVRDVYNTSPLRHVGRCGARVKKNALVNLNQENSTLEYNVIFLDRDGRYLLAANEEEELDGEIFKDAAKNAPEELQIGKRKYAVSVHRTNAWTAIGIQPLSVVKEVQYALWRSAVAVAFLGLAFGLGMSLVLGRRLSGQIRDLAQCMNQVAAGDLDVEAPVKSHDELGQLTEHFNSMTRQTKQLMERVVQEEANKRRAKYQNLEYEYRFLQWQINPHFIYNALETVNGLAKIDGNDELCEMIVLLSAYFRQNAETMRKRFLTVRQEFRSLKQYVEIYRQIYGTTLEVDFTIGEEARQAYLPTMIVQPLLENALVHGINIDGQTKIEISGTADNDRLLIRIQDNGPGMDSETLQKLLDPAQKIESPVSKEEKTSLGVKNVQERLHLIYGDAAALSITSEVGQGTLVQMTLPLSYREWDEPFHV